MERRFEVRKQAILEECDLHPRVVEGMLRRLGGGVPLLACPAVFLR